jgi:hypothetical protein
VAVPRLVGSHVANLIFGALLAWRGIELTRRRARLTFAARQVRISSRGLGWCRGRLKGFPYEFFINLLRGPFREAAKFHGLRYR